MTASTNAPGIIKRTNAFFADPTRITKRENFNPRFDFGEMEELKASIVANGLLMPLRVKRVDGNPAADFELVDGERRLTAVMALIEEGVIFADGIQVLIVDKKQDEVTSLIQMFEANTGKAFLPLEEAAAFKRMRDAGMTLEQIAQRVSRNHLHVNNTLALLEADLSVQEAVATGQVGSTMAKKIAVAARGDKAKQKDLVTKAVAAGKDKKAQRRVKVEVEQARVDTAAKKGRVVKMRALSDDQLKELGEKIEAQFTQALSDAGLPDREQFLVACADDNVLAAAFSLGALQALKAAAGLWVSLTI
jgi:ParB family chromosome partitioning protein